MVKKTDPVVLVDLDAARREAQVPDGITVRFAMTNFVLPAELPIQVVDPFLADELDLVGVVRDFMADTGADDEFLDVILEHEKLPKAFVNAVHDCLRILFGDDQYEQFIAARPSLQDLVRLVRALIPLYGVGLGELFSSATSSGDGGATSSQTSPESESTPATPSAPRRTRASSARAGSAT